jgi:hypothetical protein
MTRSNGSLAPSDLLKIPGIDRTFVKDFARINVFAVSDLFEQDAEHFVV